MYEEDFDQNVRRIVAAYPLLFRGQLPRVSSQLSKGWYGLVEALCADIQDVLGSDRCDLFVCHQIKEKFGTLRFYWSYRGTSDVFVDVLLATGVETDVMSAGGSDALKDQIRKLVEAAMSASAVTCEECGRAGKLIRTGGWYLTTRCDEHTRADDSSEALDD